METHYFFAISLLASKCLFRKLLRPTISLTKESRDSMTLTRTSLEWKTWPRKQKGTQSPTKCIGLQPFIHSFIPSLMPWPRNSEMSQCSKVGWAVKKLTQGIFCSSSLPPSPSWPFGTFIACSLQANYLRYYSISLALPFPNQSPDIPRPSLMSCSMAMYTTEFRRRVFQLDFYNHKQDSDPARTSLQSSSLSLYLGSFTHLLQTQWPLSSSSSSSLTNNYYYNNNSNNTNIIIVHPGTVDDRFTNETIFICNSLPSLIISPFTNPIKNS